MSEPIAGRQIGRRTIAKGAAWAVPTVAVVAAAPSASASPYIPVYPEFTGNWCKHPGNPKYYHNMMSWTNTDPYCDVTVTLGMMDINGVQRQAYASVDGQQVTSFTLAPDEEICFHVDAGLYDNSANGTAMLYFSWVLSCEGQPDQTGSSSISGGTLDDGSLPPCGTGSDPGNNPDLPLPHPDVTCA